MKWGEITELHPGRFVLLDTGYATADFDKQKPSFLTKIRKEGFMFITRFLAPQA